MRLIKGKFGHFLACTGYPDCKTTKNCDAKGNVTEKKEAEITDVMCPECGKPMALRNGKTGKFYGCTGYPDCKTTKPYLDPKQKTKDCPECGKPMILRNGKSGKFWGCTGYPDCKHTENEK
jgi:DNA topoisomerase-1